MCLEEKSWNVLKNQVLITKSCAKQIFSSFLGYARRSTPTEYHGSTWMRFYYVPWSGVFFSKTSQFFSFLDNSCTSSLILKGWKTFLVKDVAEQHFLCFTYEPYVYHFHFKVNIFQVKSNISQIKLDILLGKLGSFEIKINSSKSKQASSNKTLSISWNNSLFN